MYSLEMIKETLVAADEWSRKGQLSWVERCLEEALDAYLQLAVHQFDDMAAAAWLRANGVGELLERSQRTVAALSDEVKADRLPDSVLGGTYRHLLSWHVASCLGMFDLANWFIGLARRPGALETGTEFWHEYSRGLEALSRGESYSIKDLNLVRSMEKYWFPYLRLISAASRGESLAPALEAINGSFARRNVDKTLTDDTALDGSGHDPVRWDYRRDALLAYIRATKGGNKSCHLGIGEL